MFRITKKTMALVAVCALVFAACSKNESAGGNAASAQSTGSQQKSAAATSESGGGKSTKIPEPKLAEAKDFDYELTKDGKGILITKYKGASVSVIVPSEIEGFPVTEMSEYTFKDYTGKLVNVVLPDSLKELPRGMFYSKYNSDTKQSNCYTALKTVTLPADITEIPGSFFSTSSIESIVISSKVKSIGHSAFRGCKNLKTVDIQSNVLIEIGPLAFRDCTSLESIRLPDSVKIICVKAFEDCTSLKSINLPNGVAIGAYYNSDGDTFSGCSSLSEIIIPEGGKIEFIGSDHFKGCSSLSIATQARLRELGYKDSF